MKEYSIQIQSVIYGNKYKALHKAVVSIANAIRVCYERGIKLTGRLCYGDASPTPNLSDDEINEIKAIIPQGFEFIYKRFGFNSGTAKGHNILGENCESEYMMIMNPDIIVSPNCLFDLLSAFNREHIGMAEARQTPLEHAKVYNFISGETEWASTACTIFKSSLFREINGFDADSFFMYCDDLDFSWRIRQLGYSIIYRPNAIAYHSKTLSLNAQWVPTSAEIYYSAEAALILAYKWSNFKRVENILLQYKKCGGESEKKAAAEFLLRKEDGRLPVPIDNTRRIAKFLGDEYCQMRFKYS